LCRSQSHPDVVQSVSSHKKASHFLCPRNGRQFNMVDTGPVVLLAVVRDMGRSVNDFPVF
ncbi:hypothetical protein, partial [Slackia sp.]|uniref:hypothetical protein n=1 Tax=Slackia sp. TaxID=2049041 RepID=UPI00257DE767